MKIPERPQVIRVNTYFDSQNLFLSAKKAFGYKKPDFDPIKLSEYVVSQVDNAKLYDVYVYTGIHDPRKCPENLKNNAIYWNRYWANKLGILGNKGVKIFTRYLIYQKLDKIVRNKRIFKPNEKGIDVKIALDILQHASYGLYDLAIIFSTDSDLLPAIEEIKKLRDYREVWLDVNCAYIYCPEKGLERGLPNIDWLRITKQIYDNCRDETDYSDVSS